MQIEMTIKGLMVDPITNMPIIILRDKAEQRVLPIWVGVFEANAIALQIENVTTPRPMTHDLLAQVIESLGAALERIVVTELREGTFYAELFLRDGSGGVQTLSSRPSDAVALAVRTGSPIFAEESLIDEAGIEETEAATEGNEEQMVEELRKFLDQVKPEDFQP